MSRTLAEKRNKSRWNSSPEWYTEPWLVERIAAFLGADYFDPCPARNGKPLEVNGLGIPWRGKVFCNPPYGPPIPAWITKAMTEPVSEIILLVPAYTETVWFLPLLSHTICFVQGRLNFMRPGQAEPKNAPHASALVYRGKRARAFADAFAEIGPIMRPYRAYQSGAPSLWERTA